MSVDDDLLMRQGAGGGGDSRSREGTTGQRQKEMLGS